MFATRFFESIRRLSKPRSRNSCTDLHQAFIAQAAWLDAVTFGTKACEYYYGLPFEAIEGELHRIWDFHGRSEWSTVRPLILQGWNRPERANRLSRARLI
jgi:hypothetical protein